jgi:hypothetical protein
VDAIGAPLQQLKPELLLETLDRLRHRRLDDVEAPGGAGHPAEL